MYSSRMLEDEDVDNLPWYLKREWYTWWGVMSLGEREEVNFIMETQRPSVKGGVSWCIG